MGHIQDKYPELEKRGVGAVTILAQNQSRIKAFLEERPYPFPVLADSGREVVKDYGVYVKANFESVNIARPANFILSADGIVKYIHIASIQTEYPKDEDIFAVLDELQGS